MSLINQMLQELDARRAEGTGSAEYGQQVRAVPEKRRLHPAWWVALALGIALFCVTGWTLFRFVSGTPQAAKQELPLRLDTELATPIQSPRANADVHDGVPQAPAVPMAAVTAVPETAVIETSPFDGNAAAQSTSPAPLAPVAVSTAAAPAAAVSTPAVSTGASSPVAETRDKNPGQAVTPARPMAATRTTAAVARTQAEPEKDSARQKPAAGSAVPAEGVAAREALTPAAPAPAPAPAPASAPSRSASATGSPPAPSASSAARSDAHLPFPNAKRPVELSQQQRAENEYRRALVVIEQGRIDDGITGLESTLRFDARHAAARQALIGLLLNAKRQDEAIERAREGLALDVAQPGLAMILARLQLEKGAIRAAVDTLERTMPHARDRADYLAFLAALLQRDERHKPAADYYFQALERSPQNGIWWMGLGISLQADQRKAEASEAFRRAKTTNSLSPELTAFVNSRLSELQR